jgi:hypothetical protein
MSKPCRPWYREQKDCWYVTIDGKRVYLGIKGRGNRQAAHEAWHALHVNGRPEARGSVAELVREFLSDSLALLKPWSLDGR